jgi:hypothetical protein
MRTAAPSRSPLPTAPEYLTDPAVPEVLRTVLWTRVRVAPLIGVGMAVGVDVLVEVGVLVVVGVEVSVEVGVLVAKSYLAPSG